MVIANQCTSDRTADERCNTDDCKQGPSTNSDFPNVRDLGNCRRRSGDESSRAEAIEGSVDDNGRIGRSWQPEGERDDARKAAHEEEDVESADFVSDVAWDGPTEETIYLSACNGNGRLQERCFVPDCIEDRNKIASQIRTHTSRLGLQDEEVDGEKHSQEEEE